MVMLCGPQSLIGQRTGFTRIYLPGLHVGLIVRLPCLYSHAARRYFASYSACTVHTERLILTYFVSIMWPNVTKLVCQDKPQPNSWITDKTIPIKCFISRCSLFREFGSVVTVKS